MLILSLPPVHSTMMTIAALADRAPAWTTLHDRSLVTATGARLQHEHELRAAGSGAPHVAARARLFDADDEQIRVIFYRDDAAWCPYCQKVWLLLEEKKIPHRVCTVPLNAYGDKPAWFTRKVDGGKLPAIELDGELHVESVAIMRLLDETFASHGPRMVAAAGSEEAEAERACLQLEKELVRDWL